MKINKKIASCFLILCVAIIIANTVVAATTPYSFDTEVHSNFEEGFKYIINSDKEKSCTIVEYIGKAYTNMIPSSLDGYVVTRLGNGVFKDSDKLAGEVSFPDELISVGDECFSGCGMLIQVNVNNKLKSIGSNCFTKCKELKKISDCSNIERIGDRAFYNCSQLSGDLTFSSKLKSIGNEAFAKTAIKNIEFTGNIAPSISNSTFSNYSGTFTVPGDSDSYIGTQWSGALIKGLGIIGDVNGDKVINSNDAAMVLDIYNSGVPATDYQKKVADVNHDGVINSNDSAMILDMYTQGK